MAEQQFAQLLAALNSPDNELRQRHEAEFAEARRQDPDQLAQFLLKFLSSHADSTIRHTSAVLLKQVLQEQLKDLKSTGSWRISDATCAFIQQGLLQTLTQESIRTVRVAVCTLLSDFGGELLSDGNWASLGPTLLELAQRGPTPGARAAGLRVLSELTPQLPVYLREQSQVVAELVTAALADGNTEVVSEGLALVMSTVQSGQTACWKKCQTCLPTLVQTLQKLVQQGPEEAAVDYLVKLTEIAEWASSFFRPQLVPLVETCFRTANNKGVPNEVRQMAVELLLCIAKDRPKACVKLPRFVEEMVATLLNMMLSVEDDAEWLDRLDDDDDVDEETRNYDIGEAGLDRITEALGGEHVMPIIFRFVGEYISRPDWQYKLVAIMAIAQTVEYLPEDTAAQHLEEIVTLLLAHLKLDQHHRVRFVVCQAIGQAALDHRPLFQQNFAAEILPALTAALDDPVVRVRCHAAAALINFAEDVEVADLAPLMDVLMERLFKRFDVSEPLRMREQALTCMAVVAGVVGSGIAKYYNVLFPMLKRVIETASSKEERDLRGKAIEGVSILGSAVGPLFKTDAHEVMGAILKLSTLKYDDDDNFIEYVQEALCRMARVMGQEDFAQYAPQVVHQLLKDCHISTEELSDDEAEGREDVTLVSIAEGRYTAVKTAAVSAMIRSLDTLTVVVEVVEDRLNELITACVKDVMPIIDSPFSEDAKRAALACMAGLLKAARQYSARVGVADLSLVQSWLGQVLETTMKGLDAQTSADSDPDMMFVLCGGLAKCLRSAGSGVLAPGQVGSICEKTLQLMRASAQRKAEIMAGKADPDLEEEDMLHYDGACEAEENLRTELLEILTALMGKHGEHFVLTCSGLIRDFLAEHIAPSASAEDRGLGLSLADHILEYLGDAGAPFWPLFAEPLVACLLDSSADLRRAAAYGFVAATAFCKSFPEDVLAAALPRLVQVIREPDASIPANRSATDNAIAALGSIIINRNSLVASNLEDYCNVWVGAMPLTHDEDEARRAHDELMQLALDNSPLVLGPSNSRVPKLVEICAFIYGSDLSTAKTDAKIRRIISGVGFEAIEPMAVQFPKKLQRALQRIHWDCNNEAASPSAQHS